MNERDPLQGTIFGGDKPEAPQKPKRQRPIAAPATEHKSGMIILGVLVGLVVLVLLIGVIYMAVNPQDMKARDEDKGEYIDSTAVAELSADGIKGAVTKAYYALDGSIAVFLDLGNGMATPQRPLSLYLELENEQGQVIGAGRADSVPEDFYVPAGERRAFLLYIAPEHVQLTDDDLDHLAYELTIQSEDFS